MEPWCSLVNTLPCQGRDREFESRRLILYVIGAVIKNSRIKDWKIPFILGALGILLAGLWIFSANTITGTQQVLSMIFASITQGVLCAAAGVYTDNLYRQLKEKNREQKSGY